MNTFIRKSIGVNAALVGVIGAVGIIFITGFLVSTYSWIFIPLIFLIGPLWIGCEKAIDWSLND